ncbi:MAG TPA: hypothetical protein DCQ36_11585 [Actinobacteria bacterium]|jgi:hypothetical protein|nr:hypothetical protein [Actinomycetota bacterium]
MSTWSWRLEQRDGSPAGEGRSQSFPSQADAETWIGETWRDLLDGGVDQVVLLEEEREVYGPMGLHPAP